MNTAVFGGSFDPVHIEHVSLAKAAVTELNLKKLIIVPTCTPPHKDNAEVSFLDRVNMLKLAFKDFKAEVVISDIEKTTDTKNYAVEIIPKLRAQYGDFYYLIGGDSLLHFESWQRYNEILSSTKLAVFNRDGYPDCGIISESYNKKYGADITVLKYVGQGVSSSVLKADLYLNEDTEAILPEVKQYIKYNGLYSKYNGITVKVQKLLTERKFIHSKNVVRTALRISSRHNLKLSFDDIFLAGLLHDIGYNAQSNDGVPSDAVGTPVAHQFAGAFQAERMFNINDEDILTAIKYHCTGRAEMSTLEKLIYTADMISEERNFTGVDKLREVVYNDFNEGFKACLNASFNHLQIKNTGIYPLTKIAYSYYNK